MNYLRPELIDRLAAEYVLGTLAGPARRRFETLIRQHEPIRRRVNQWQDHFNPLSASLSPVRPPARVWQALAQRLALPGAKPLAKPRWYDSLAFWRAGSALALAAVLGLAVMLAYRGSGPEPSAATTVAVLDSQQGSGKLLVKFDAQRNELALDTAGRVVPPSGRDLELWALPADAKPVSLGVVRLSAAHRLRLSAAQRAAFDRSGALAVSVEPIGGSPSGQPTGAIVLSGKVLLRQS
ncbi:anti-sigma factor domain-containing protein [Chitinimonas sp.]|uniref:anti-sigma factor n=1 Tax=Chitinimonas sp. TaxID=1934313 RepID=UPI0035B0F916